MFIFVGGKYREMEFGFVYFFIPMWFFWPFGN